jgi:soluble lytic murein transglycosylase-like protein
MGMRLLHLTCCALAFTALTQAYAAELVTLRSGFTVHCVSHESVSTDTVRLHLHAGDDNYMDVPTTSILAVEAAPDEPVATVSAAPSKPIDTATILADSGAKHNVNVALLASVVKAESAGNPHAVSRTGARGLMQLMPGTAAQLGVTDSFAPADNVNGGSAYLDQLLTRYHNNLPLALAAYNAGPAAVDRYHGIPPYRETQQYVARVIREFNRQVLAAQLSSTAALERNQKLHP